MISAYTGTQVRAAEAPLLEAGKGAALMQRAAYGLYQAVAASLRQRGGRVYGSRVVVLAGSGNNGGDALYAAALLARRGARTTAVLTSAGPGGSARAHPDALAAFRRTGGREHLLAAGNVGELALLGAEADVVIDGILGTGAAGGLREPAAGLVRMLDDAGPARPLVVACDLPSGVDSDSGRTAGPVLRADLTVTFGAVKTGLLADPGAAAAGRVQTVDIGLGQSGIPAVHRLEAPDLARLWPVPRHADHKYSRGVLGIVAGSAKYPGAALLAVEAAAAAGTGMIRYLGPEKVGRLVLIRTPEAVCSQASVADSRVQAWLIGPGAVGDDGQLDRMRDALDSGLPVVADAGAFTALPDAPRLAPHHILTPHAGELAALLSRLASGGRHHLEDEPGETIERADIEAAPLYWVREAARRTGATILLKGPVTLVASPAGAVFSQQDGTPWMATAGSGDVLAGILGALTAAADRIGSADPADQGLFHRHDRWAVLAAMAAAVHGHAGVLAGGGGPLSAVSLLRQVPAVVAHFCNMTGVTGNGQ
jgi:ADP-dependent NAD(P)H-hydrate dehydratase / NAD(P)H-hydrate epimerase